MDILAFSISPIVYFLGIFYVSYRLRSPGAMGDGDYFLAGRNLGVFTSLVSVVATETSVASIIVFPAMGYGSGFQVLWLAAGYILGRFIVSRYILKRLYNTKSVSIYSEMAEQSRLSHDSLGGAYLTAKFISSGVRFFMGGFALHQLFGGSTEHWMGVIAVVVGFYSLSGGLKAVVVTDQIQGYIIAFMGILFLIILPLEFSIVADSFVSSIPLLYDLSFEGGTNPSYSPAFFIGGTILSIGTHGADQDMIQRILAVRNFDSAKKSLFLSGIGAFIIIAIYSGVGILLRHTGLELDPRSPLVSYVADHAGPFLSGLFAVLLIAAAMSTMDSAIHSTGAVWKALFRSDRNGRLWSFLSLVLLFLAGLGFIEIQEHYSNFLGLAMGSMNYVNGGLIGIVLVHTLLPGKLGGSGIILALLSGLLTTVVATYVVDPAVAWSWIVVLSGSAGFLGAYLPSFLTREAN